MPKVSVITGYYNRGEHLERTVRSVLDQTFADLELIAFDDASTDGTAAKLTALSEQLSDARFSFVVHEKNKGFTQGMIDAIAQSSGTYIAVQGSGDISLPRRLERQVALLDAHPEVGVVGCWYDNVVPDTGVRRPRKPDANNATFDSLLRGNVFSHGEVMFRRSVYDSAGGYRAAFKNTQDYDLWLRMVKLAQLATVPETLYERYVRFDGVSYDPKKFALQARYFLLTQRIARLPVAEAEEMVSRLAKEGPVALVPQNDRALQKRYFSAALRSIAWGATQQAETLARECLLDPAKRNLVITMARLFGAKLSAPLRSVVQRALGVQ